MGLTELLLGKTNPVSQYVGSNRNALRGAFAGFGQGRNFSDGLGQAALGANQGAGQDDAYAIQQAAEAKRQEQLMQAVEKMRRVNPKIADLVAGAGPEAIESGWNAIMKGMSGSTEPLEINGQLVDPNTYEVLGDFRTPDQPKAPSAPAGYQFAPDGQSLQFIPGGPADPAAQAANKGDTEQTRRAKQLASMVNPELQVVEQNWDALSNGWDQMKNADIGAFGIGIGRPGRMLTDPGFQQASNALQTIAQSYLYSVSGAAAPAEEVRKIVESVTPTFGESEESRNDKKARVRQMVEAINLMAAGGVVPPGAQPTNYVYNPATGELEPK